MLMLSILCVGSINLDILYYTQKIPRDGENLLGREYLFLPGGKGANQAVAVKRCGSDAVFCGKVGEDDFGRKLEKHLKEEKIDSSFLFHDREEKTGVAGIIVDGRGENRIIMFPGANLAFTVDDVSKAFSRSYDGVITNLEIPMDTVLQTAETAYRMGIPFFLDAGPALSFDFSQLSPIEIFSPNQTEAETFTGIPCGDVPGTVKAAEKLYSMTRTKYVVIKMGALGALIYDGKKSVHVPAFPIQAVDPTAAGDAFTAALTVKYLQIRDIEKSVLFGNGAGALAAQKKGAQTSLPFYNDIIAFITGRKESYRIVK